MKRNEPNRQANIWIARGLPVFCLGIIGYASWVVTKALCVDYLLRSPPVTFLRIQTGPATAILVLYYILLCMTLVCYARLLYVVTKYPGLVPRGSHWYKEHKIGRSSRRSRTRGRRRDDMEKIKTPDSEIHQDRRTSEAVTNSLAVDADLQVGDFWQREIFTCNHDGRPAFCSTCYNWKPDRTRHCSELDRCVLKMDHFCPWAGGVIGETSFKFFVQFTFWAALYCIHVLVVVAYYFAQRRRVEGVINVHWTVVLALSGFFVFFSAGMCMSSLQFVFINSTTIENLSRKTKVWYLAVHIPQHLLQQIDERGRSNLKLITYPRPPEEQFQVLQQNGVEIGQDTLDNGMRSNTVLQPPQETRTFAILESTPGSNPFDLGYKRNFLDIMGTTLSEWFLPIQPSPCVRHDPGEPFYRMGAVIAQVKHEARIFDGTSSEPNKRKRSRRRRRDSERHSRRRSHSTRAGR